MDSTENTMQALVLATHVAHWVEIPGNRPANHSRQTPTISDKHSGPKRLSILTDINLSVSAGEAVAIVGASGSGKSTLLGLLAGLDRCKEGEIQLFGNTLNSLDEDARAALRLGEVGFVFQSFQLLSGMTALENVALPLELNGDSTSGTQAMEALQAVGLGERLHHYPSQLSGGEQQRVAVARAFATRPRLLFADEPTANLDIATGTQIIDLLFQLREQHGVALLLVTHDSDLAMRCDRRLQLVSGVLHTDQI